MGFSIKVVFIILILSMIIFSTGNFLAFSQKTDSTQEKPIQSFSSENSVLLSENTKTSSQEKLPQKDPPTRITESDDSTSVSIPEELVLQGVEFNLYLEEDQKMKDVKNDKSLDVRFVDSDGNKVVDKIEWKGSPGKAQKYLINADLTNTIELNVDSVLKKMKEKIEKNFYEKTITMLNARASGNLNEYLEGQRIHLTSETIVESSEYYDLIILVNKASQNGVDPEAVSKQNKDLLENALINEYDVNQYYKAKHLSFITASVLPEEIPKLVQHDFVSLIGDGELVPAPELDISKQVVNAISLPAGLDGSGKIASMIDTGIDQDHLDLPVGAGKVIRQALCSSSGCDDTLPTSNYDDFVGHGTGTAGIVGGLGAVLSDFAGVAPGSQLINAKYTSGSGFVNAFDYSILNL